VQTRDPDALNARHEFGIRKHRTLGHNRCLRREEGLGLEREAENGLFTFLLLTGANRLTHFAWSLAAHGFQDRLSEGQFRRECNGHLRPSNRLQRQPVAAHELEGQEERQQPESSVHQGGMIADVVGALSTEKPVTGSFETKRRSGV
jgi:hypothetical protein